MSKNKYEDTADEVIAIFFKALKKADKTMRNAEFESFFDRARAEDFHHRLKDSVVQAITDIAMGEEACGECDGCIEQCAEDSEAEVYPFPAPQFNLHEVTVNASADAAEVAMEFQRLIGRMMDEKESPNAARFLSGLDVTFTGKTDEGSLAEARARIVSPEDYFGPTKKSVDEVRKAAKAVFGMDSEQEYDPKGWPLNTPVAEMTEGEQVLWWRHQSRKNEARAKKYYAEANDLREQIRVATTPVPHFRGVPLFPSVRNSLWLQGRHG